MALGTVYALHMYSYTWKCAGITYYATCQYVWNFEYIDRYHCLIGSLQVKMENMDIVVTQLFHFPNGKVLALAMMSVRASIINGEAAG